MKKLLFILLIALCVYLELKTNYKVLSTLWNGIIYLFNNIKELIL